MEIIVLCACLWQILSSGTVALNLIGDESEGRIVGQLRTG